MVQAEAWSPEESKKKSMMTPKIKDVSNKSILGVSNGSRIITNVYGNNII